MVAKRRQGLIEELAQVPWWVGVASGAVGYVALAYFLPVIELDNPMLEAMANAASKLAPLWLVACLGGAGLSALNAWKNGRLYAAQRQAPNLNNLSWEEFERLVGEHFHSKGYRVIDRGGSRPDGGIDLIVTKAQERYVVQCKHWKARQVGVGVVRELVGSITQDGAAGGFLVTSGTLTKPASRLSQEAGIEVLDGRALVAELRRSTDDTQANGMDRQSSPSSQLLCPVCRSPMRLRTAKKGKHAGTQFWGCSSFPQCRGTRPV